MRLGSSSPKSDSSAQILGSPGHSPSSLHTVGSAAASPSQLVTIDSAGSGRRANKNFTKWIWIIVGLIVLLLIDLIVLFFLAPRYPFFAQIGDLTEIATLHRVLEKDYVDSCPVDCPKKNDSLYLPTTIYFKTNSRKKDSYQIIVQRGDMQYKIKTRLLEVDQGDEYLIEKTQLHACNPNQKCTIYEDKQYLLEFQPTTAYRNVIFNPENPYQFEYGNTPQITPQTKATKVKTFKIVCWVLFGVILILLVLSPLY